MKFRAQIVLTQAYQFNNKVCYVRVYQRGRRKQIIPIT